MNSKIIKQGMGSFLDPPTHPEHDWSVQTDLRRRPDNRGGMSLSSAVDCEWLDPATRVAAKKMLDDWQHPIDHEWVLQVLGFFKGCYAGSQGWAVPVLVLDKRDPMEHIDKHAGVHFIRKFYPDYVPTLEDFRDAYWGQKSA